MGLVDYANSSGSEEDEPLIDGPLVLKQTSSSDTNLQNLFATLPPAIKVEENIIEEQADEFLKKKAQEVEIPAKRIRINVPDLPTIVDEVDVGNSSGKVKKTKCGLFAVLPTPKMVPITNTSFIPKSLKKNVEAVPKPSKCIEAKVCAAPIPHVTKRAISDSESETEDNAIVTPDAFDVQVWDELFTKKKRLALPKVKNQAVQELDSTINLTPEVEKPYTGLDNEAFKALVGNRRKVKEEIKLMEVMEEEIHPDREEWLKSLTDPNFGAEPEVKKPVNHTSLVKNHITSLAERALQNNNHLQMRWAESRHSRNQTRTKYGF